MTNKYLNGPQRLEKEIKPIENQRKNGYKNHSEYWEES